MDLTDFFELKKVLQPPGFGVSFSCMHVNLRGGIEEEALEVATIPMEIPGKSPEADTLNPPTVNTATSPFLSIEAKKLVERCPRSLKLRLPRFHNIQLQDSSNDLHDLIDTGIRRLLTAATIPLRHALNPIRTLANSTVLRSTDTPPAL